MRNVPRFRDLPDRAVTQPKPSRHDVVGVNHNTLSTLLRRVWTRVVVMPNRYTLRPPSVHAVERRKSTAPKCMNCYYLRIEDVAPSGRGSRRLLFFCEEVNCVIGCHSNMERNPHEPYGE